MNSLWRLMPAVLFLSTPALSHSAPPDDRLDWWRDARFGLFIHWGPVSLRGTEIGWSRGDQVPETDYDQLYRSFNPTNFDARAWARLAHDAGTKYLVLTSKHHDGFCLWDSAYTDYDMASTPFRRDVVRELAAACRKENVVFCTYHSICDWRHPDYPLGSPGGRSPKASPDMTRYTAYLKGQIAELIGNYGPLGVMWFDGEWEAPWTEALGRDLYDHCRRLQPSLIVNNRVGKARQGMTGTSKTGAFPGDYDTPEQEVGKFQNDRPWESCITLCQQWAWKPDDKLKSLEECLRTLVFCAGGDGNLLLNVGPMPDGRIEPRQAERLREIGRWLDRHGNTVYRTRGGPFKPGPWGASTHRGKTVYLHVLEWPQSNRLILPALEARVRRARLLTGGQVQCHQSEAGIELTVARPHQAPLNTLVELRLDTDAGSLTPR